MSKLEDSFIPQKVTIEDAMHIIDNTEKKIGFVVDDDKKFVGVVNDGDLRRALLGGKKKTDKVLSVTNTNPIMDEKVARERMKGTDTRYMVIPVVDDKGFVIDCNVIMRDGVIKRKKESRVLIIGGAGYLGSVLCRKLLRKGYKVRVLDVLLYGEEGIKSLYKNPDFELVKGDMRDLKVLVRSISDVDVVIHLAAIVGDTASAINPTETIQTNYLSTQMVGLVCKFAQINRLIFASTCSVYGATVGTMFLSEDAKLHPVSLYAEMKLESEKALLEISDKNFKPTIFRMATLHGISPRMRFDLSVNIMTIRAIYEGEVTVHGGTQHRAFCHVEDAADAYIKCIESPISRKQQVFNIVSENVQISTLADMIHKYVPSYVVTKKIVDLRNYMSNGTRAKKAFGLKFKKTITDSISDIKKNANKFKQYNSTKYSNYEHLFTEVDR